MEKAIHVRKICVVLLAVVGIGGMAMADVAIWTNLTAGAQQWGIPENWTDAEGNVLTVAPTNGTHDIKLPAIATDGSRRSIITGSLTGSNANTYLEPPAVNPSILSIGPTGGVWDTWRWNIGNASYIQYRQPNFKRWFTIADASDYDGYWTVGDAKTIYKLDATAERTPYMSSLGAKNRPYVEVATAGTAGELGAIHQPGTVSKRGAGELKVATTQGVETRFTVDAGTLTLEGRDDAEIEPLLKTAALRLDATREDTITTYQKTTDGVEYSIVTNWFDANGNGIHGYQELQNGLWGGQYYFPESHGAFMSPVKSPTGLPLVDFGSHIKDNGRFGPSNCWLKLSTRISNPRAVFYAVQTPGKAQGRTILGTSGDDSFAFLTENGDTRLFCTYSAGALGRNGDIMINGEPVSYDDTAKYVTTTLTNLNVISVAIQPGAKIGMIAADRHYTSRSCGSRLGEVLIFTNELARAQRVRVAQYLVRKWMTGDADAPDANAVVVNNASAAIGVPEGRTARVDAVTALGGKFTKKGGGTLAVGSVYPENARITVEGGAVAFAGAKTVATDAPAADPYVWLDANDADAGKLTTETFAGDDHTYVTHWRDHRADVDITAIAISNTLPRMPWVDADIGNGRGKGINLGDSTITNQSFFILPTWGADGAYGSGSGNTSDTYAGFIAYRPNSSHKTVNIFGSSNMDMMRSANTLLSTSYTHPQSPSAFWSINGFPVDPFENTSAYIKQFTDVIVVAFRSPVPLTVNAIAKDRKGQGSAQDLSAGNMTVGEFITYHRPLTDEEFRNTEAYLMKKWLGKDHPAMLVQEKMASATFGPEAEMVLDSGRDMEVGNVMGGNGALVKRGDGSVTASVAPVSAIAVEGGNLTADISLEPRAYFHFDASKTNTFTTYDGEDGRKFITRWDDASTNGVYACSMRASSYYKTAYLKFVMTNPVLEKVTMPDGALRPAVYFGGYRNTASQQESGTNAASFYFTRNIKGETAAEWQNSVREIYVIQQEYGTKAGAHFIGNLHGGAVAAESSTTYMRADAKIFNPTYTSSRVQNGYLAVDRVPKVVTDTLPSGWHLMSVGATDFTRVDAIMQDRDCNAGGGYIGEMIAFDFPLSAEERANLERHLMRKWGIGSEAVPTQTLTSVTVAAGASLAVGDNAVRTDLLGGGGTLTAEDVTLTDGGTLAFEYRAANDVDHLAVNGPLALDGAATVRVTFAEGAVVAGGEWTLLSATGGIAGLNLAATAFDITLPAKWRTKLFVRNGALGLRIAPKGTMLNFR